MMGIPACPGKMDVRKFEISGDVRFELKGRTLTVFDK